MNKIKTLFKSKAKKSDDLINSNNETTDIQFASSSELDETSEENSLEKKTYY